MNKPTIRIKANGLRQFDVTFKLMIVRACNNAKYGETRAILDEYQLSNVRLQYWRRQFNEGHFTANRAVAFSRKQIMVHG